MKLEDTLFIIPARGGSKGIPGKNIKLLNGKPLIYYSIDFARIFTSDENICVTSDDNEIIAKVEEYNLSVPFQRPAELASDTAGTYEVLRHAISYYENIGKKYSKIVLLQPTSPIRNVSDYIEMDALYSNDMDMLVSVTESKSNPYYNLFEENENGYLTKSKTGNFIRRQDCPKIYEFNGSIYIFNIESLKKSDILNFKKIHKYVMSPEYGLDLDTSFDWELMEIIISAKNRL